MNKIEKKQKGFTIIELVVVILLLGILTATALPRFMDVSDQAHDAVRDAVLSGLQSGVALFNAQWVAQGEPTTAIAQFGSMFANSSGYPIGSDATFTTTADCVNVYQNLLQEGGRPTINATGLAASGTDLVEASISSVTEDFYPHLNTSTNVCQFAYTGQFGTGTAGGVPVINFDADTGTLALGTEL